MTEIREIDMKRDLDKKECIKVKDMVDGHITCHKRSIKNLKESRLHRKICWKEGKQLNLYIKKEEYINGYIEMLSNEIKALEEINSKLQLQIKEVE